MDLSCLLGTQRVSNTSETALGINRQLILLHIFTDVIPISSTVFDIIILFFQSGRPLKKLYKILRLKLF